MDTSGTSAELDREFPVLLSDSERQRHPDWPRAVPWSLLQPHERQADRNHGQTLKRLAERGGLSPAEMVAVLEDRRWQRMDPEAAVARLNELVRQHAGWEMRKK